MESIVRNAIFGRNFEKMYKNLLPFKIVLNEMNKSKMEEIERAKIPPYTVASTVTSLPKNSNNTCVPLGTRRAFIIISILLIPINSGLHFFNASPLSCVKLTTIKIKQLNNKNNG